MNIGIFAFGRAGCRIADRFKRFEIRSMTHISEFILAADTASEQLNTLSKIDEDWQFLFGYQQFEGTGTRADLEPAVSAAKKSAGNLKAVINNVDTDDIDAFVVIGSLGGGTGAAGAPLCAKILGRNFKQTPVYGVGILPASCEADMYTLNAARSIQSFSSETDNLFLFDNNHLGVAMPESNPSVDDDADPDDVFTKVNQDIARCLHMVFSADEKKEPSHLTGTTADTEGVINVLSAGGLSTMCYVTETLPRPARPGITGRVWELLDYFKTVHQQKRYDQQQQQKNETGHQDTTGDGPHPDPLSLFTDAKNVSLGTGPDSDVESETTDALVTRDSEVGITDLPRVPTRSDPAHPNPMEYDRPSFEREWPHPVKLVPFTLDSHTAMMDVDPSIAVRNLYLLAGPKQHLSQHSAINTAEWADEHTNASVSVAKNYPVKHKKVAALTVCSGIGIPERVQELQREASQIAQRAIEAQQSQVNPKDFNVFENEETVPPAL